MNKNIRDTITDFLFDEDNYLIFDQIIDNDHEKRTLLVEYSKNLIEYCKVTEKEENY